MSACSLSILSLNPVLTHGIPPEFRGGGVHIFLPAPHTIGSVSSLSGHAIAYRLRSLSRVRWHRASSPQGSSSNGCCLCIPMDQMLLCSSLFPHPLLVYSEYCSVWSQTGRYMSWSWTGTGALALQIYLVYTHYLYYYRPG